MGKVIKAPRRGGHAGWWRRLGHECASGWLDVDRSGAREGVVGVPDSVEIDLKGHRDLSHGGHSFTRLEETGADSPHELISYLHVDRNAGLFDL